MTVYNALLIEEKDNVCVLRREVKEGEMVCFLRGNESVSLKALEDIPIYYKVAVAPIRKGEPVMKYHVKIGLATVDIHPGEQVHTHNLISG